MDELEDWILPLLDKIEVKEFMQQELSTIENQLRVRVCLYIGCVCGVRDKGLWMRMECDFVSEN